MSTSRAISNRAIPIVMDAGALSDASVKAASHDHADDPSQPLAGPAPVFVMVGDTPIDEAEIAREMQFHRADNPHDARQAAATTLVIRELVRRECERLQLAVEALDGETEDEARVRALVDAEVPLPAADDAALLQYFEANRARLHHPDAIRVRHILLAAAPSDIAARRRAQQTGEELIGALRAEPDRFIEFAMRHSACPSRDQGGELGWIERGDTVPEFDRQLFMLKPGFAGLTVETRYGHHVVEVLERVDGEPLSFEDARDRITAYLETQAQQNALHQYLHILAQRYGVEGIALGD
ncbi:peptidylprolyl isomerase [Thermomonas sp.]|uniref:peptidylprolyl isomerase n=1 Tax=Thermomonas sp. TaxID=1971895 RepID=UPI0035B23724